MFGYFSAAYSSVLKYIVNMKLFLHMLVCLCILVQTADECLWSSYFGVRLMCLELFSGFEFSTVSFVCHEVFCEEFFVLCKLQIWSVVGYAFCVVVCSCLCVMLTLCMNQEFPRMDVSLTSLSSLHFPSPAFCCLQSCVAHSFPFICWYVSQENGWQVYLTISFVLKSFPY